MLQYANNGLMNSLLLHERAVDESLGRWLSCIGSFLLGARMVNSVVLEYVIFVSLLLCGCDSGRRSLLGQLLPSHCAVSGLCVVICKDYSFSYCILHCGYKVCPSSLTTSFPEAPVCGTALHIDTCKHSARCVSILSGGLGARGQQAPVSLIGGLKLLDGHEQGAHS